jgi:PPM family protein phosphatase
MEAHLMIKLTAITSEEEPHSTVAAFLVSPDARVRRGARRRLARLPLPRREMVQRTSDHSFVQRLIDEGKLTEERPTRTRSPTCSPAAWAPARTRR